MEAQRFLQLIAVALMAVFTVLFLTQRDYFVVHHLLIAFSLLMDALIGTLLYLRVVSGEMTKKDALVTAVILVVFLLLAVYMDATSNHALRIMDSLGTQS